ncbi:hypothetical protein ZWY2020_018639 [Hordeum vulgare]|nr:hypothetical protein ZWY2020_018639 [Hordeum vulgare]
MAPASSMAALAAVLVALQLSAAADEDGCSRSCGEVDVPYPFGVIGDPGGAACYLPGLNLTCETSPDSKPPRLLLGDGSLQVVNISLQNATLRAVHAGEMKIDADGNGTLGGGLRVHGPYKLSFYNELTVTGCNVMATLHEESSHTVMSACASFCSVPAVGSRLTPTRVRGGPGKYCNGNECCQAPIDVIRDEAAGYIRFKWFGQNVSADQERLPARVFVAEEEWFDSHHEGALAVPLSEDAMAVPILLEWVIVDVDPPPSKDHTKWFSGRCPIRVATNICKSNNSVCGKDRGYSCYCEGGYEGNPYVPGGCQDINECERPEGSQCVGKCTNTQGSFECECPSGTHRDHNLANGCVPLVTITEKATKATPTSSMDAKGGASYLKVSNNSGRIVDLFVPFELMKRTS